jgi:hypothetical protein
LGVSGKQVGITTRALTIARDAFLIECRTCQRISDLKRFDLKDVEGNVWTNTVHKGRRIRITRTRIPFDTAFTSPAWKILAKYGFKFPELSEQKINKHIKTVCRLAGIDQLNVRRAVWVVTKSHLGFITIALLYLFPKLVKDLAGISWGTLRHYEGQTEDQALIDGLNSIPATPLLKIAQ